VGRSNRPVLFQAVAGVQVQVQVSVFCTIGDSNEVTDAKIDACCLVAGCGGYLDVVLADEVYLPPLFLLVGDDPDLL
jgi:hypothetical protein